ncbi:hypothetical protein P691DRAFT_53238 [Macrolepiota fuliginosa MF-IS2]|uniref:Uncharacterized protein n=1 Tax=Macrolepiota fuliginosa MF-IS2 TaxID=1400762 RepID=A0A9P5XBH8_9AGAR|nr:hypothetical protein P691DRAFT_53238 [Macrolepiota fuliginosa MF-IS2]
MVLQLNHVYQNLNQPSHTPHSPVAAVPTISVSVKYCRAVVGWTVATGTFGFGRCVSTAWIGKAYLWVE